MKENSKVYSYENLMKDIYKINKENKYIKFGYIGKSVLKNKIPYIKIGNGKNKLCTMVDFMQMNGLHQKY